MTSSNHLIASISAMRALLLEMEGAAGLDALAPAERDVLCAAHAAQVGADGLLSSESIRRNPIARHLSLPTYQRALRSLVRKGYLRRAPGRKRGSYVIE